MASFLAAAARPSTYCCRIVPRTLASTRRSFTTTLTSSSSSSTTSTPAAAAAHDTAVSPSKDSETSLAHESTPGKLRIPQAPNREGTWSKSQQPRELAMTGPRFEQTILDAQPRPEAAIELIHKQPVRWVDGRRVACDGGGGPVGHPRIFINLDKPEIHWCTYCGLPYANSHHKKHIESLPTHNYPLSAATADPGRATLPESLSLHGTVEGEGAEKAQPH